VLLMSFDQTGGSSPDDPVSQAVANWRLHDMSPNPFSTPAPSGPAAPPPGGSTTLRYCSLTHRAPARAN